MSWRVVAVGIVVCGWGAVPGCYGSSLDDDEVPSEGTGGRPVIACSTDDECPSPLFCATALGRCVECLEDADCGNDVCTSNTCMSASTGGSGGGARGGSAGQTSVAGSGGTGAQGGAGGGGATANAGAGNAGSSMGSDAGAGGGPTGCMDAGDCDDDNACTQDTCPDGTCQHELIALPAKGSWSASASSYDGENVMCAVSIQTPSMAIDGNLASRWSSGKEQAGDEWFQVDFGAPVVLNKVTLDTFDQASVCGAATDYPRHYQVRVSDLPTNFAAPVNVEGDGAGDLTVIQFPAPATGRYLLISQTGTASPSWWSVAELEAACE